MWACISKKRRGRVKEQGYPSFALLGTAAGQILERMDQKWGVEALLWIRRVGLRAARSSLPGVALAIMRPPVGSQLGCGKARGCGIQEGKIGGF